MWVVEEEKEVVMWGIGVGGEGERWVAGCSADAVWLLVRLEVCETTVKL